MKYILKYFLILIGINLLTRHFRTVGGKHSIKGLVIGTKSFVKIGITKIFYCTTTKCLVLSTKR